MNHLKVKLAAGLYFVGVPIGSARDITLRALDTLNSADILAAEDTRSLRKLLDIHGVALAGRTLVALHDHSNTSVINKLIEAIAGGQSVAYASEAGMPLIADPGFEIGRAASKAGHYVTCAPGPSAVSTALVVSGMPTDSFLFSGFLPNARSARCAAMEQVRDIESTLVFYESPKRLSAMLSDAASVFGKDRAAVVCRELTKKFEEKRQGSLADLAAYYEENKPKGEIVVLIGRAHSQSFSEIDLESDLKAALRTHSMRDAVDMVSKANNVPRRQVYQMALAFSKEA